jgi:hypothetical protein
VVAEKQMKFDKPLFSDKYLAIKRHSFTAFQIPVFKEKLHSICRWKEAIEIGAVNQSKEESLKATFLQQVFVEALGYSHQKDSGRWSLEFEQKTSLDSTKMDGALGFFKMENNAIQTDVRAVIELINR